MSNAATTSASAGDATTSKPGAHVNGTNAGSAVVPQDTTKDINSRLAYVPRDARLMALILQSMGVEDVQPPVLMMLLEFAQRYLHEVLQDALVYADHANSAKASSTGVSTLTADDVQLAIQARVNHSFTGPPSKDMLLALASSLNSVPLPPVSDKYGVKLPPAQHCLTNVNFSIIPDLPADEDADGEEDEDDVSGSGDVKQSARKDEDASIADEDMEDQAGNEGQAAQARGTKRSLDEDDDYD